MNWIKRISGITEMIKQQDEILVLLKEISEQSKRNADLQEKHNKAYHIR